jgi:hypothetical protein
MFCFEFFEEFRPFAGTSVSVPIAHNRSIFPPSVLRPVVSRQKIPSERYHPPALHSQFQGLPEVSRLIAYERAAKAA